MIVVAYGASVHVRVRTRGPAENEVGVPPLGEAEQEAVVEGVELRDREIDHDRDDERTA